MAAHSGDSATSGPARAFVAVTVALWMLSNMGVLLLNKVLLSDSFRSPILLTFLHMASGSAFVWTGWGLQLWTVQRVRSSGQLVKLAALSTVLVASVLSANCSLQFITVSMNQAIGALTPACTALFAFLLQGKVETLKTYSALLPVVGGVLLASGVEPQLHVIGAMLCLGATAFRGIRSVLQAILLQPEEKLDSMSCMAYMQPISSILLLTLAWSMEPASLYFAPFRGENGTFTMGIAAANCAAAFLSNYLNMAVTKQTSALTVQVLGQCKGLLTATVGTIVFQNHVPILGWTGYLVTCAGCIVYGSLKLRTLESPNGQAMDATKAQLLRNESKFDKMMAASGALAWEKPQAVPPTHVLVRAIGTPVDSGSDESRASMSYAGSGSDLSRLLLSHNASTASELERNEPSMLKIREESVIGLPAMEIDGDDDVHVRPFMGRS